MLHPANTEEDNDKQKLNLTFNNTASTARSRNKDASRECDYTADNLVEKLKSDLMQCHTKDVLLNLFLSGCCFYFYRIDYNLGYLIDCNNESSAASSAAEIGEEVYFP